MPSPTCEKCQEKIRFLKDLFWSAGGTRICGKCYKMEIKAGDTVEVVDIGGVLCLHPTEERNIKNGDILHIKSVNGVHVYLDGKASTGVLAKRFKKVEEQPTVLVKNDCTCPDLLNGHHNGCPYLRKD